jgi:hypothetical protein
LNHITIFINGADHILNKVPSDFIDLSANNVATPYLLNILFIIKPFSMAITMQNSWVVSFKSKSAARDQRFIIAGASSGNGTYNGVPGETAFVNGTSWTVSVQHHESGGWRNSREKITTPYIASSFYHFDIRSEDSVDDDFNDLVLTCSAVATSSDFLVHGNVSYYDHCWRNPCYLHWVVIDTYKGLREAIAHKPIHDIITKLYPERLKSVIRVPNLPDPPPDFTPIMIPLSEETALPPKTRMQVRSKKMEMNMSSKSKKDGETTSYNQLISASRVTAAKNTFASTLTAQERLSIGLIADKYHLYCDTGALPYAILNFQEYDRTNAELAGGPYTGLGNRQQLGFAVADEFGNYIYRFTRTLSDVIDEITLDTASGESTSYTVMPDIIVQLKDATNTNNVLFETALYPDIPFLKRIDLCIPKSKTGLIPFPCNGQSIIQRVGNTVVGPLFGDGTRHDATNDTFLTANGIISINHNGSVRYSISPVAKCCAWGQTHSLDALAIWGCLSHPDIKSYIVRYKKHGAANIPANWKFITDGLSLPYYAWDPVTLTHSQLVNIPVGLSLNLVIDGALMNNAPAFKNVETDSDPYWMNSMRNLKAKLTSANYTTDPGPIDFKIEGFNGAGHPFGGSEIITLYIDNTPADMYIDPNMSMAGTAGNDCALYTLPAGDHASPLTVNFRAVLKSGFMKSYQLYMEKGATGSFAIKGAAGEHITNSYADGSAALCSNNFRGTVEEASADISGNYTVHVKPDTGDWLTSTQLFCAFGVYLSGSIRRTDGNSAYPGVNASPSVLIGIQK